MPYYKPNLTNNLEINKELPLIMHVDMNSYFASCEQQENPLLRGKPVGVVPYLNDHSAILAASYQAKALGIKTGTRVLEAKKICKDIKVVLADPPKYRYINKKFMKVFKKICPDVHAKSIDEAYLNFKKVPSIDLLLQNHKIGTVPLNESLSTKTQELRIGTAHLEGRSLMEIHKQKMTELAVYIKQEIKKEVGEYINCSIGVGTNTFIAKVASGINKPDGFYYVDYTNINTFYDILQLQDLHGVGPRINARLNKINIFTCKDFLNCDLYKLKAEFKFWGTQWYLKIRGFECDDIDFKRKNVGHSYHLVKFTNHSSELNAIVLKLTEKTATKLRKLNFSARCFSVFVIYKNREHFSKSHRIKSYINSTKDLYTQFLNLLDFSPHKEKQVRIIGISTSYLKKQHLNLQVDLFGENTKKQNFNKAIDTINNKHGKFTIYPANLNNYKHVAPDRIAFGK